MRPSAKGWCPGAYTPMTSGDGLIVRLRPRLSRLSLHQALDICDLAERHGTGVIEVTSKSNLQLRGIKRDQYKDILDSLLALGLLDETAEIESRRNIIIAPDWEQGCLSQAIAKEFYERLPELPELPAKFSFALDVGKTRRLAAISSDIRIEQSENGAVLVCADSAEKGLTVAPSNAITAAIKLAHWFANTGGNDRKRMQAHLQTQILPDEWQTQARTSNDAPIAPGRSDIGFVLGVPLGQTDSKHLRQLLLSHTPNGIRLTPWRGLIFEGIDNITTPHFIINHTDTLLTVQACPGAPSCKSATVETRNLARALAGQTNGVLHVSGCSKGCAHPKAADITLVGENGQFSLIKKGCSWDNPSRRGLSAEEILNSTDVL